MMVEGMVRRHIQNGKIHLPGFVRELVAAIDAFESLYLNYQQTTCYVLAAKMAYFDDQPTDCFLSNDAWRDFVDFEKIQLSISMQYVQVLDISMIALMTHM